MSAVLREHQYELSSQGSPDVSVVFGTIDTGLMTLPVPSISSEEGRLGDNPRGAADGITFGVDRTGNKTVTFEMGAFAPEGSATPQADASDIVERFEAVWTDRRFRDRSGDIGILRSVRAGRARRCYGRPRRFAESVSALLHQGYMNVVCDFVLNEDRWYDDTQQSVVARLLPVSDGGLRSPLVEPLTSYPSSSGANEARVGGTKPTWALVRFAGPSTNPRLSIGNALTIGLRGSVPLGEVVLVDPRPWVLATYRVSDYADMGGLIDPAVTPRLSRCFIDPGVHPLTYTAIDATATSTAQLVWRNAYARP